MTADLDVRTSRGSSTGAAYPVSDWAQWHADRERTLQQEYGWLTLTGFHWLPEQAGELPGLPGRWWADPDVAEATFTGDDGVELWDREGDAAAGPLHGDVRATVDEQGSLRWLRWGDRQIELARRGGRYAVRIRDPHAATRTEFGGVPTFPLDPVWVRPAGVVPRGQSEVTSVATARGDLRQQARLDVDVLLALPDGSEMSLAATVGADGGLSILFHDITNDVDTAAWRVIFAAAPDDGGRTELDFNRALNMPFSFSDFGTCPAPVPGNRIPVAVTAGELAPPAVPGHHTITTSSKV